MISLLINLTTFYVNYMVIYNMFMSLSIINGILRPFCSLFMLAVQLVSFIFLCHNQGGALICAFCSNFKKLQILPMSKTCLGSVW